MKETKIGEVYQHYKGSKVKVLARAMHSETLEMMVVYVHLRDGGVWVRPEKMFLENVVKNGKEMPRFKKMFPYT